MAYDAKGRRDPFTPVSLASESKGINVTAAKLVGIVRAPQGTWPSWKGRMASATSSRTETASETDE